MKTLLLLLLLAVSASAAVRFDGTDDYLNFSDATHPTEYTVAAWVMIETNRSTPIFYRTDAGALPSTAFSHSLRVTNTIMDGFKFEHYFYDGAVKRVTGTTSISTGVWYHVVGTAKNSGNCRLYVNGVEEGTAVAVGTLWASGTRYLSGAANAGGTSYFKGRIADTAFWSKELVLAEVAALANSRMKYHPNMIQSASLRWYLPLDDVADQGTFSGAGTVRDRSGNVRNWTPNNSPVAWAVGEEQMSYP